MIRGCWTWWSPTRRRCRSTQLGVRTLDIGRRSHHCSPALNNNLSSANLPLHRLSQCGGGKRREARHFACAMLPRQRDATPAASCCAHRSREGAFRLELQSQTQLWGVVESLVTLPAQARDVSDVILLTFRWVSSLACEFGQSPRRGQAILERRSTAARPFPIHSCVSPFGYSNHAFRRSHVILAPLEGHGAVHEHDGLNFVGRSKSVTSRARDAKLAVLEWDAESSSLRPNSLHYFEGDTGLRGRRTVFARPPVVRTDPQVLDRPMLQREAFRASRNNFDADGLRQQTQCHQLHAAVVFGLTSSSDCKSTFHQILST